jgi:hypothetical protein
MVVQEAPEDVGSRRRFTLAGIRTVCPRAVLGKQRNVALRLEPLEHFDGKLGFRRLENAIFLC